MRSFVRAALAVSAAMLAAGGAARAQDPGDLAATLVRHVKEANEAHLKAPGNNTEADLARKLPADAKAVADKLCRLKEPKPVEPLVEALAVACDAALDLDLAADFEKLSKRLRALDAARADQVGIIISRPRFLMRGTNGVEPDCLKRWADMLDAILDAYDEVFEMKHFSKVPGKKLRVLVHVEAKPGAPHFAPQFPFHSEVDFPVLNGKVLRSPTPQGHFLFYGLAHEMGHVLAMWGDLKNEEDHHAWAHYTGIVIVGHLAAKSPLPAAILGFSDAKSRCIPVEMQRLGDAKPSLQDRDGTLALLIALHEEVGPAALGRALNALDKSDRCLRINRVRYYSFANLRAALLEAAKKPAVKKKIQALLRAG